MKSKGEELLLYQLCPSRYKDMQTKVVCVLRHSSCLWETQSKAIIQFLTFKKRKNYIHRLGTHYSSNMLPWERPALFVGMFSRKETRWLPFLWFRGRIKLPGTDWEPVDSWLHFSKHTLMERAYHYHTSALANSFLIVQWRELEVYGLQVWWMTIHVYYGFKHTNNHFCNEKVQLLLPVAQPMSTSSPAQAISVFLFCSSVHMNSHCSNVLQLQC